MKIFPAIDIRSGVVVRLTHGDYDRMEVYGGEPACVAMAFRQSGADNLHIVDLDGAKDGKLSNFAVIEGIVRDCGMFVEVGGGIRDMERIEKYLSAGVSRVILGTAALKAPAFLREAIEKFPGSIAVGVDTKDGLVAVDGWLTVTEKSGFDFCRELRDMGVGTVICTDIAKDGALEGINLGLYEDLQKIGGLDIIASGGVTTCNDIRALRGAGVHGAIVGKALYTGALTLEQVLEAAG